MLMATASSSAVHQYLCAYSSTALSEFFVITGEFASLLILDDGSLTSFPVIETLVMVK